MHPQARAAILARAEALALDPRPRGAAPLRGRLGGLYRIRVGDYRVAYHVDDGEGVVTVVAVGPRGGFYESMRHGRGR